jgi:hypothetical protein
MSEHIELNLEEIGRTIAQEVAGNLTVEEAEAAEGEDWTGKPAYYFAFLIDEKREPPPQFSLSVRISMRIRDELVARGDYRMPFVRVVSHKDWDKRGRGWAG